MAKKKTDTPVDATTAVAGKSVPKETKAKVELTDAEKEVKSAEQKKKDAERFAKLTKAVVSAFKTDSAADILSNLSGKFTPAQITELVTTKKITEDQKKQMIDLGLQKSIYTRTKSEGVSKPRVELPYMWKTFHKYDPANKDSKEQKPEVIAAATALTVSMKAFYEANKANLDIIESNCQAVLMTYFRFPASEKPVAPATPAA